MVRKTKVKNGKRASKATIYGLRVKGDAEYFYIGSTERDPQERLRAHLYSVASRSEKKNPFVALKVLSAGRKNIEIETIEQVPVFRRFKREYQLINEYKARGIDLCNIRLSEAVPPWAIEQKEAVNRKLVAFFEGHAERCHKEGPSSVVERLWDIQIVRLKIDSNEINTSPDLLRRIRALSWPFFEPILPTKSELKEFCDILGFNAYQRAEFYHAAKVVVQ